MRIEIEWITPQRAKEMLACNTANFRPPDRARVSRYARDMSCDRWLLTGEPLKFNGTILLDGQHRLLAIIESGCTVQMAVAWDVPSEAAVAMDTGKTRTAAQWLAHKGYKSSPALAAAARLVAIYDRGGWGTSSWRQGEITGQDVIQLAEANYQPLLDSIRLSSRSRGFNLPQAALTVILFIGSGRKSPRENAVATWFSDRLSKGDELAETDPAFQLRKRFFAQNQSSKLTPFYGRMLCTLAWNKTVLGESCRQLRIRMTGPGAEPLPKEILVAEEEG